MNVALKLAMLSANVTQKEVAERAGIHESILSRAIRGKYDLNKAQREAISHALGRLPADLGFSTEPNR